MDNFDIVNSEPNANRLMALTLISSYLEKDSYQYKAIRNELTDEQIIEELIKLAIVFSASASLSLGTKPEELSSGHVLGILETLRKISHKPDSKG